MGKCYCVDGDYRDRRLSMKSLHLEQELLLSEIQISLFIRAFTTMADISLLKACLTGRLT